MTEQTVGVTEFRVGNVLGRGFSILLKNIVPFGLLALLVSSPPTIYALVSGGPSTMEASEAMEAGTIGTILSIVSFLLGYLVTAVLVYGTIRELRGDRASIGDCIKGGLAVLLPVIGVAIVAGLATLVGSVLLIIPGVIVFVVLWVAIPAAVVERPGVFASLSRSAELTKGHRWQIFGLVLLLVALGAIVTLVVAAAMGGLTAYTQSGSTPILLINLAISAFFVALWAVVSAVSYHDLRVAKEGIGTEDIAAVFD